jgi:hypothetical protein
MDDSEYLRLLEAHDDLRGWYCSVDFDHDAAERRFQEFARELQSLFGVKCWVGSGEYAQDCSFLGEVSLPPDLFNRADRVSNPVAIWAAGLPPGLWLGIPPAGA